MKIVAMTKNKALNLTVKILCIASVIAMIVIACTIYKANVPALSIYIVFMLFYVQVPGMFILRISRFRFNHISTALCTGFFTGWAFMICQYFLTELIQTNVILYVLGPLCSLLYIVDLIAGRFNKARPIFGSALCAKHFKFKALSTALCIFIVLLLYYAMVNTQFLYLNPGYSVSTYMNPDKAYHIGLIDSLSHGWPLESPWVQGRIIKYHIFTELLFAIPVRLFSLPADVAIFSLNPILTTYVFGLSTYVFFKEMLTKKNRAGLCCLTVILANLFLVRSIRTSMALHFAAINDNAVGYGLSCAMLVVVLFKLWYEQYSNNARQLKELILLIFITMLMTGIKGPIALVLVASIWSVYILGIIMRKVQLRAILPILLVSSGFLFIYITIMSGKGASNGSGDSIFAFATIANISFFREPLVLLLKGLGIPKLIRLSVMLVVFMIFMLTAFILPTTVGYIRELILVFSGKKNYDLSRILVYAAFLIGLVLMFVMNYSGYSQVYFGLVSVFFAPLVSFWFFEDTDDKHGVLMKTVRIIFIISIVLCSLTFFSYCKASADDAVSHSDPSNEYSTYLSISNAEYDAMKWIDKNTAKDSLLATDRYSSVPPEDYSYENRWSNRFFLYAVYSNRFCYIAGSGYNFPAGDWLIRKEMIETNMQLYDVNNEKRGDLARKLGVDYLIVSKRFNDFGDLGNKDYCIVYSNNDIDIYKIKACR